MCGVNVSDSEVEDKATDESRVPPVTLSVLGGRKKGKGKRKSPSRPTELAEGTVRRPRGARRGDMIGNRYVVEGTLGRGGMGRVMSVRHQVLGKSFALKLIKNRMADDERIRDMFYREGRVLSGLSHEGICSIVDFGEDPAFGPFMVMELLDGISLKAKLMHDGRLAPKVACDVMLQIADALRYIHSRGIIHGDIKSDNILLTRAADKRRVIKLLDFGLARAAQGEKPEHVDGTPEYLAPERIGRKEATARSDIYALGILFYELLVGRLPFSGTVDELFKAHLEEPCPLPSDILGRKIDERADEIVARATAKNPEHRHEDVAAFIYELRTFMNMMGIRRRSGESLLIPTTIRRRINNPNAASEVFELAPLPLASINSDGVIVVGNRAFLEFLGRSSLEPDLKLVDTSLADVYPGLETDLDRALGGKSVKKLLSLSEGGSSEVEVALLLSAPPIEDLHASGEVHLAIHPLARRAKTVDDFDADELDDDDDD
jgi:serine/threonine protein kinase